MKYLLEFREDSLAICMGFDPRLFYLHQASHVLLKVARQGQRNGTVVDRNDLRYKIGSLKSESQRCFSAPDTACQYLDRKCVLHHRAERVIHRVAYDRCAFKPLFLDKQLHV